MSRRWLKLFVAALLVVGVSFGVVGFTATAGADDIELAGRDIDGDGDRDEDDLKFVYAGVGAILAIGVVWFFVFRGGEDDTGFDPEVDSEPMLKKDGDGGSGGDGDDDA